MGHLGDLLSALVDGELDHDCRDRVLAHLATCPPCRQRADAERQVKAQLAHASLPSLPLELSARLRALADLGSQPPTDAAPMGRGAGGRVRTGLPARPTPPGSGASRSGPHPITRVRAAGGLPATAPPGAHRPPRVARGARGARGASATAGSARTSRRTSRVGLLAAGAATAGGAALGGTAALGASVAEPVPQVRAPLDAIAAQQAASGAHLPAGDPTSAVQLASVSGAFLLRTAAAPANRGALARPATRSWSVPPLLSASPAAHQAVLVSHAPLPYAPLPYAPLPYAPRSAGFLLQDTGLAPAPPPWRWSGATR